MSHIILRIKGTECSIPTKEFGIERIIAEARSAGFNEFNVYCNGAIITSPDQFIIEEGAIYVISSPEDEAELDQEIDEMASKHEQENPEEAS
jgi:Trk K+ transport system NAD-binding subunit